MELRIPKLGRTNNLTTILLVITIMALSFALGVMYMKMRYLEDTGGGSAPTTATNARDAFVTYAKQAKLNVKNFSSCLDQTKYSGRVTAQIQEGDKLGVHATPTFFVNGKKIGGAFPYEDFKNVIDKELDGTASEDYKQYSAQLQQAYEDAQGKAFDPVPVSIELGDAPVRGTGKVTIVEFSDFQCPFCQRAVSTVNQVLNTYKGKVTLIYKHYPIPSLHPNATMAANASECAREQGKFWEYHDILFNTQTAWSSLPQANPTVAL
jgi:protein-disulfide isomerase